MSQLVNAEVNSGDRKAVLASNCTLHLRICGCHAGVKCDLKGIKHCSHCVWLAQESKYNPSIPPPIHSLSLSSLTRYKDVTGHVSQSVCNNYYILTNQKNLKCMIVSLSSRPYFTYWISFVQTVVLIVALAVYRFAPIGFTETTKEGVVIILKIA